MGCSLKASSDDMEDQEDLYDQISKYNDPVSLYLDFKEVDTLEKEIEELRKNRRLIVGKTIPTKFVTLDFGFCEDAKRLKRQFDFMGLGIERKTERLSVLLDIIASEFKEHDVRIKRLDFDIDTVLTTLQKCGKNNIRKVGYWCTKHLGKVSPSAKIKRIR